MTDIPEQAIDRALGAMRRAQHSFDLATQRLPGFERVTMRAALEAAAPHILAVIAGEVTEICTDTVLEAVAAERERIRQLARAKQAVCGGRSGDPDLLRPFADLIGEDQT